MGSASSAYTVPFNKPRKMYSSIALCLPCLRCLLRVRAELAVPDRREDHRVAVPAVEVVLGEAGLAHGQCLEAALRLDRVARRRARGGAGGRRRRGRGRRGAGGG